MEAERMAAEGLKSDQLPIPGVRSHSLPHSIDFIYVFSFSVLLVPVSACLQCFYSHRQKVGDLQAKLAEKRAEEERLEAEEEAKRKERATLAAYDVCLFECDWIWILFM
jgi:hypothetical protein